MLFVTNWFKIDSCRPCPGGVYGTTTDGLVYIVRDDRIEVRNALNRVVPFNKHVEGPRDVRDVCIFADGSIRILSASLGARTFGGAWCGIVRVMRG